MTVPDVADYAGSAAFIDTGRLLDSQNNAVANGYQSPNVDVSRFQSVGVNIQWLGANTSAPGQVNLIWSEAGQVVWQDVFTVWNGWALNASGQNTYLQVPCIGSSLQVQATQPALNDRITYQLIGSSRPLPRPRVSAQGAPVLGGGASRQGVALAVGATDTSYIGPFVGDTVIRCGAGGQTMSFVFNAEIPSAGTISELVAFNVSTNGASISPTLTIPGVAMKVAVTNNGSAAANFQWLVTAVA